MEYTDFDQEEEKELSAKGEKAITTIMIVVLVMLNIAYVWLLSSTISSVFGLHIVFSLLISIACSLVKLSVIFIKRLFVFLFGKRIHNSQIDVEISLGCFIEYIVWLGEFNLLCWMFIREPYAEFTYPGMRFIALLFGSSLLCVIPVFLFRSYGNVKQKKKKIESLLAQKEKAAGQQAMEQADSQTVVQESANPSVKQEDTARADAQTTTETEQPLSSDQKKCWACDTVQSASNIYCENCHEKL